MIAVAQGLDWGEVIAAVVPSVISLLTVVFTALIHRQIKTPSGDPIGHVVERAHETGIANNLLLRTSMAETRTATTEELHHAAENGLEIPAAEGGTA